MNDWVEEEVIELEKDKEPVAILASKGSRIMAFILDLVLISAFTFMVLSTFVIPTIYPDALKELKTLASEHLSQKDLVAKMTPRLKEMIETSQTIIVFAFWLYFAANEILLKGSSLGKKVFSIRVVNEVTLEPPSAFDSLLRSGLKTFSLLAWFPLFTVNFLIIFFTKKGQAGHDFLSRTVVVQNNGKEEVKEDDYAE